MENITDAKIYVGTYAKYNDGSIFGKWFDLADYDTKEEFIEDCAELHADEADPEFMFQDWENIPEDYIGEGWVSERLFEIISAVKDLDESEVEPFGVWLEYTSEDKSKSFEDLISTFRDQYCGEYESEVEYAEEIIDTCYPDVTGIAKDYFDYKSFARDLFMSEYDYEGGYVFRNC